MCDQVQTILTKRNVFGIEDEYFELFDNIEDGCDDTVDPLTRFNNYCLIPVGPSDNMGSTCDPSNYTQSNFLFRELYTGNITTLSELPIVWKSSPMVSDKKEIWVEISDAKNTQRILENNIFLMGASNESQSMIFLDTSYNSFESKKNGTFYPIEVTKSNSALFTFTSISSDGLLKVIGSINEYFYNYNNTGWSDENFITGTLSQMFVFKLDSSHYLTTVTSQISQDLHLYNIRVYQDSFNVNDGYLEFQSLWFGISSSQAVALSSDNLKFFYLNAHSDLVELVFYTWSNNVITWTANLPIVTPIPDLKILPCAASYGFTGVGSYYYINVVFENYGLIRYRINQNGSSPTILGNKEVETLSSSQDGKYQVYNEKIDGFKTWLIVEGVNEYDITPTIISEPRTYTRCVTVDLEGKVIILKYGEQTYYCSTLETTGNNWQTDYIMYKNLSVSDFGSPDLDVNDWNPGQSWFKGWLTAVPPDDTLTLHTSNPQNFIIYAQHNEYKLSVNVYKGPSSTSVLKAPCIRNDDLPKLYRVNEVYLIKNLGYITTISNDGNINVMKKNTFEIVWTNNMHDKGPGDPLDNNDVHLTRPYSSPNGIYMSWWDSTDKTFVVSAYAFNSSRFANYVIPQPSVFSQALNAQQDFCFDNLLMSTQPYEYRFGDKRCSCIGGQRLFDRVFINIDLIPANEVSLMLANLGCLMADCTSSRVYPQLTIASQSANDKCVTPFVLCSNIIRNQGAIGNIEIDQNCGASYTDCTNNQDCPIGNSCVKGKCLNYCQNTGDCNNQGSLIFECKGNLCLPANNNSGLSSGAIIGIVLASIIIIVLIVVLCWYFLIKKKK